MLNTRLVPAQLSSARLGKAWNHSFTFKLLSCPQKKVLCCQKFLKISHLISVRRRLSQLIPIPTQKKIDKSNSLWLIWLESGWIRDWACVNVLTWRSSPIPGPPIEQELEYSLTKMQSSEMQKHTFLGPVCTYLRHKHIPRWTNEWVSGAYHHVLPDLLVSCENQSMMRKRMRMIMIETYCFLADTIQYPVIPCWVLCRVLLLLQFRFNMGLLSVTHFKNDAEPFFPSFDLKSILISSLAIQPDRQPVSQRASEPVSNPAKRRRKRKENKKKKKQKFRAQAS